MLANGVSFVFKVKVSFSASPGEIFFPKGVTENTTVFEAGRWDI